MTDKNKNGSRTDLYTLQRWSPVVAFAVFLVAVLYLLLLEHRAHVVQALPYLLIGVCVAVFLMFLRVARSDRTTPRQPVPRKEVDTHDR